MEQNLPERRLDFIGCVAHIETTRRVGFGQEVLDDPHPHIIAQPFELFIHIFHALKITQHLGH